MHSSVFITGTDTNIGKTFVSAMLLSAALSHQLNLRYFKPIQTGMTSLDCDTIKHLTHANDATIMQPVFSLQSPVAPYRAALAENRKIGFDPIEKCFKKIGNVPCIVEGAGGLLVPLTKALCIRDLIKHLNLPLLIIAGTQLGTINHTLLTIEAALAHHIAIKGIIYSGQPDPGLSDIIKQLTAIPILTEIPWLDDVSPKNFQKISATIFTPSLLKLIFS